MSAADTLEESMPVAKTMTLHVIESHPVYSGVNDVGHAYTIYEVKAAKPSGEVIGEKLRSFVSLPVGESVEVTVSPFVSAKYGRSFNIHPAQPEDDLKTLVEALAARVEALEKRLAGEPALAADPGFG